MGRAFSKLLSLVAGIAVFSVAAPAFADDGLELSPSSEWRFREYDDRCQVSRNFGEGEDRTALWIEQGVAEPIYNVTLIGRPLRHPYGGGVHLKFGKKPEMIREVAAVMLDLRFDLNRAESITTLRLRTSIVESLLLELGSMADPLVFLDECRTKLSGVLSEAGRLLTGEATPPEPIDQRRWLKRSDYPLYLLAAAMEGQIRVRLTVNTAGRASSCFVTKSKNLSCSTIPFASAC